MSFFRAVTSLDQNCPQAGVAPAFDVDRLVADEKRAGEIDVVIALRFEDHSGRRFTTVGRQVRSIGAKINGVESCRQNRAGHFRFDQTVLRLA